MGTVAAVCISTKKGTAKRPVPVGKLVADHGLENDAHAGNWHRQVSLLSLERIEDFKKRGALVNFGDFGENLVVSDIDFVALPVGTRLATSSVLLEITQIGKECHTRCAIYHSMGECIMPTQGVFAKVVTGGEIKAGDSMRVCNTDVRKVAILTLSDKGCAGQREDVSGREIKTAVEQNGYSVVYARILPDEQKLISDELRRICDNSMADLVLTTGGTGFSTRDVTPEATLEVVERLCPGIPEAMRAFSLNITKRAMLTRAVAGIRGQTLIVNLPGSPKAVRECLELILDPLEHGLDILAGKTRDCAR